MDQDAFRILVASGSGSSVPRAEASTFYGHKKKKRHQNEESSKPAFKPRTHGKVEERYRDRATERRGGASDYAEVEKVLEDFERVNTGLDQEMIEEQRKYLGGDEKHTVLVKGLDFALLQQQKSRLNNEKDADDEVALEEAFKTVSAPKKRTREEIIQELKQSRESVSASIPSVDRGLEIAKQSGKFRPIGAPIETKVKKRKPKTEGEGEKKKKKRKLEEEETSRVAIPTSTDAERNPSAPMDSSLSNRPRSPSPAVDPDVDIFADAEEWRGLDSDSDTSNEPTSKPTATHAPATHTVDETDGKPKYNWFGEKIEEPKPTPSKQKQKEQVLKATKEVEVDNEDQEPSKPERLQGLASSTVPSIRDILAMDEAAEKEEKRKARKEKKKEKKLSEETKINREVKQLEKYVATKSK